MRYILFLVLATVLIAASPAYAQDTNPNYNKALADSLGADDYGMRTYMFVLLRSGSSEVKDKEARTKLFKGHLQNIQRLADEGKLVVAGPFLKENERNYSGLFILNAKSQQEAKAMLDTDPAIKAKLLVPEIYEWYGSAALPMYLPFYKSLERKKM